MSGERDKMTRQPATPTETLERFFAECSSLVGAQWVKTDKADVAPDGSVAIAFATSVHMPAGVVCPYTSE